MEENNTPTYTDSTESIKITKNTKGFNWEIKIIKTQEQTDEQWLARLHKLNTEMAVIYDTPKVEKKE